MMKQQAMDLRMVPSYWKDLNKFKNREYFIILAKKKQVAIVKSVYSDAEIYSRVCFCSVCIYKDRFKLKKHTLILMTLIDDFSINIGFEKKIFLAFVEIADFLATFSKHLIFFWNWLQSIF